MDYIVTLLSDPNTWAALITLTTLEIVLGIDNIVMIAILVSALPKNQQDFTRRLGIGFALLTRVGLLFTMSWLASLTNPLFFIMEHPFSVRDLVMFFGGIFLVYKGFHELFELTQVHEEKAHTLGKHIYTVVLQIGFFDIVFSLDSVITAVGMSNQLPVMVTAIVIAMAVMLFASGPLVKIIDTHLSIKVLALAFLLIIGFMLTLSGFGIHIPKGYIYAAMGFSALVQFFIIFVDSRRARAGIK
jgi:predicted tellurium resistance membrane protein TerC